LRMPRKFRSISDMSREIAGRKSRAARARSEGRPADAELPKDVYAEACRTVAARFAADGFKFAKSGPHFVRNRGTSPSKCHSNRATTTSPANTSRS
jgi:hypothetical protein